MSTTYMAHWQMERGRWLNLREASASVFMIKKSPFVCPSVVLLWLVVFKNVFVVKKRVCLFVCLFLHLGGHFEKVWFSVSWQRFLAVEIVFAVAYLIKEGKLVWLGEAGILCFLCSFCVLNVCISCSCFFIFVLFMICFFVALHVRCFFLFHRKQ